MLDVEYLSCANPKYNKGCRWVHAKIRYPDERYVLLKNRLITEVKQTHTAYRIVHWKFGVLLTIKWGHDQKIFLQENTDALRQFALY